MYPIVASLVRDTGGLPATSEEEKTYATKGDEHWTTKNEDETSNASTKLD